MAIKELKVLDQKLYNIARAIAEAIIPAGGAFEPGANEVDAALLFDHYIDRLSRIQFRFIKYILYMIQYTPLLTKFKLFTRMSLGERIKYLQGWEESRVSSKRYIFITLKLLIMMPFYSDDRIQDAIGIHSSMGEHPECLLKV